MIVIDTSVVVAVMRGEPDAADWLDILDRAPKSLMSVVSYVETNMVIAGRRRGADSQHVEALLKALRIDIVPVTLDQGIAAVTAFLKYGKGRHPAHLNLSDCFAYALAKSRDLPLLFKGNDFVRTDIVSAQHL